MIELTLLEWVMVMVAVICIIYVASIYYCIRRDTIKFKNQLHKETEMVKYHFWLCEAGLAETAYSFNRFGLSVTNGKGIP